jgi:hypothetical protein
VFFFIASGLIHVFMSADSTSARERFFKRIRTAIFTFGANGLIAVGLTLFWLLPLVCYYSYLNTFPTFPAPSPRWILVNIGIIPFSIFGGIYFSFFKKNRDLAVYTLGIILLIPTILLQWFLSSYGIPSHVQRWISGIFVTLPIMAGLIYNDLPSITKSKAVRVTIFCIFVLIFSVSMNKWSFTYVDGLYVYTERDRYQELMKYIETHPRQGLMHFQVMTIR